jgi:hypothetical protein
MIPPSASAGSEGSPNCPRRPSPSSTADSSVRAAIHSSSSAAASRTRSYLLACASASWYRPEARAASRLTTASDTCCHARLMTTMASSTSVSARSSPCAQVSRSMVVPRMSASACASPIQMRRCPFSTRVTVCCRHPGMPCSVIASASCAWVIPLRSRVVRRLVANRRSASNGTAPSASSSSPITSPYIRCVLQCIADGCTTLGC